MGNTIIQVAIHDLLKQDGKFEIVMGADSLDHTPTTQRVIDSLYELYRQRGTKSHGKFSDDKDLYPTERFLTTYIADPATRFPSLVQSMMATLKNRAASRPAAVGGHVFFAHFQRDSRQYLLVAIVNDKVSAALSKAYQVTDVQHLDIDGFRFAGRINITGWLDHDDRYISFLKGKGDVAEYFREFLGCDVASAEKADTRELKEALNDYAAQKGFVEAEKQEFIKRAYDYCDLQARLKQELHFQALANAVMPHEPEPFLYYLTDPDRKLNDGFIPNRQSLRSMLKIKGDTEFWRLEFDRSAISKGQVEYDVERNELILRGIPPTMMQDIKDEL